MDTQQLGQNFGDAAYNALVTAEGRGNYIYGDPKGIPTVGAGIALLTGSTGNYSPLSNSQLTALFSSMGLSVPANLSSSLQTAANNVNSGNYSANYTTFPVT